MNMKLITLYTAMLALTACGKVETFSLDAVQKVDEGAEVINTVIGAGVEQRLGRRSQEFRWLCEKGIDVSRHMTWLAQDTFQPFQCNWDVIEERRIPVDKSVSTDEVE